MIVQKIFFFCFFLCRLIKFKSYRRGHEQVSQSFFAKWKLSEIPFEVWGQLEPLKATFWRLCELDDEIYGKCIRNNCFTHQHPSNIHISSPKGFCRVHTALFPPQPLIDNSKFPQEVFVIQLKIMINQTVPAVASLRQFWICARLYWKITVLLSLLWEKSGRGVRKLLLASPATPPLLFVSCTW